MVVIVMMTLLQVTSQTCLMSTPQQFKSKSLRSSLLRLKMRPLSLINHFALLVKHDSRDNEDVPNKELEDKYFRFLAM